MATITITSSRPVVYPVTEKHEYRKFKDTQVLALFDNIDQEYAKLVTDPLSPGMQERGFTHKTNRTSDGRIFISLTLTGHSNWRSWVSVEEMRTGYEKVSDAANPRRSASPPTAMVTGRRTQGTKERKKEQRTNTERMVITQGGRLVSESPTPTESKTVINPSSSYPPQPPHYPPVSHLPKFQAHTPQSPRSHPPAP